MPNIDAINKIMAAIENEQIAVLNMQSIIDETFTSPDDEEPACGTSACIYGFAILTQYGVMTHKEWITSSEVPDALDDEMQELFGLNEEHLSELVFASESKVPLGSITKDMALNALIDVKQGRFKSWNEYR